MIGTQIAQYKILEELGRGGMGIVYKAEDIKLNRIVALKFLPHHLTANEEEQARFLQEAKAAATLNHPNICIIHGIEEHEGQQFIEMEYVDGETLRSRISEGELRTAEAIGFAIQIGEALHEAHSKGIVHRDVKAENIMVNSKHQVKVMDFGLAKLKGSMKLTRTSSTVGTLAYMAPEQIQGVDVDARSDIFSFGIVLFEMLTGRTPFRGEHEAAMMYSILNEVPETLRKYREECPPELERIVARALEKDPGDRYQHVDDMVSELRRLQKQTSRVMRAAPESVRPEGTIAGETTTPAPAAGGTRVKPKTAKSTLILAGVAAVIVVAAALLYFGVLAPKSEIKSMAVLPFVNATGDPNTEYLSDGFTESLINTLSKLPGIRMMSRSSVFRFKGKDIDPQKAGEELGVDAVLTGRILQRANELSISVELLNAHDNSHIWGDQFNRGLSDIVALQTEISQKISDELKITLTGDQRSQLSKPSTGNSAAYQQYLKGRFYLNKRSKEGFERAIQYFRQAIDQDPSYAYAYAGLSDTYGLMGAYFILPPNEAVEKARASAQKALALDGSLGEPHVMLATLAENRREWSTVEPEYKRALELSPNYATGHQWYGEFLCAAGRPEAGVAEVKKAQELDPLAPIIYCSLGQIYTYLRRTEDAVQQFNKSLELDPDFTRGHAGLAWAYLQKKSYEDAIREAQKAIATSDSGLEYVATLAYVRGMAGQNAEAEGILKHLLGLSKVQFVSPSLIGVVYIAVGDKEQALLWLNRAIDSYDPAMEYINEDPMFDPLRGDPRFAALVKKVGLPL